MQPIHDTQKVNSRRRDHMLEMGFGHSPVAGTTGTERNRCLSHRPFDSRTSGTLRSKVRGLLALAGALLRFKVRLGKEDGERPPFLMVIGAAGDDRTDRAIRVAELNFHDWAI